MDKQGRTPRPPRYGHEMLMSIPRGKSALNAPSEDVPRVTLDQLLSFLNLAIDSSARVHGVSL